jgi:hypothetical protein
MAENTDDKAIGVNISLYPKQIENVRIFSGGNKFHSLSEAYQYIIDDFFNKDKEQLKKQLMVYLFWPIVFCAFASFASIFTGKVNGILIKQGLYFDELYTLSQIFMVIGFGSVGILAASIYLLRNKMKENY